MAEKKVTTMVIKVDLECEKCHKKIKKNQIYDKKAGTVTITVVCCSPEKIKEKIVYKGGEAVKSIEIKVPEKPKTPAAPAAAAAAPPAPAPEKPAPKPSKQSDKPPETVDGNGKSKGPAKPKALIVEPVHPRTCCAEHYRGISGGPCYHDYGRPAPPCYEAYGRPVYDSWFGGGYGCQRSGYYACRGSDQSLDKTMAEKKVTIMVIKVDLECEKCHKKIKKVLCRIPLEAHVIKTMVGQHLHVMKVMEGQCLIVGLAAAAAAVAKEAVTMCADVNMSVKIIPRHAQSCESIKNVDIALSRFPPKITGA
ncbi:hypothetical protein NC653_015398 [Populus alba x Populus x berolinensis]|uniref:HMA domain-containing protein n=1 Tax=Populus alba x Populus x berolinensis TaxID=444605 RepID=A0AAD6VY62_9ROSI|nr:hypothetical protein NC653_015398 [Populus alba x Populus x berolinensis]